MTAENSEQDSENFWDCTSASKTQRLAPYWVMLIEALKKVGADLSPIAGERSLKKKKSIFVHQILERIRNRPTPPCLLQAGFSIIRWLTIVMQFPDHH